jgi:hypothetical protein
MDTNLYRERISKAKVDPLNAATDLMIRLDDNMLTGLIYDQYPIFEKNWDTEDKDIARRALEQSPEYIAQQHEKIVREYQEAKIKKEKEDDDIYNSQPIDDTWVQAMIATAESNIN